MRLKLPQKHEVPLSGSCLPPQIIQLPAAEIAYCSDRIGLPRPANALPWRGNPIPFDENPFPCTGKH